MIVYDCTLRDGMQGEGMALTAEEKLRVAHVLDGLGVPMVEAGFPASNPKEEAFFDLLSRETFKQTQVAAFGMTRRRGVRADEDPALRLIAGGFAPVATIVGKTWSLHLEKVVKVDPDENLRMIADSVAFLVAEGKRVVYDAEHFFDGYDEDPAYALRCLRAAAEAGAQWVVPCNTNGGHLPHEVAAATAAVVAHLPGVGVGTHCHDDAGVGVANSIAAVQAGAGMVQGTMNGYGERCGNANLTSIVPNLQLKLGIDCLPTLENWTEASHLLDELLNLVPDPDAPYVGKNAFAHKGGMHVAGVNADPRTFEHIEPEVVGNRREILVSELSGKATLLAHAQARGLVLDDDRAADVLRRVKRAEHQGYAYDAADGSVDLLIQRATGQYSPLFTLESWRLIIEQKAERVSTEATLRLWIEGRRRVRVAEGNGPVHALDLALRGAIIEHYPELGNIELTNYKVRILDDRWPDTATGTGTGATTRVLLESHDSESGESWGTAGVGENVISASWDALVESLEAGLLRARQPTAGRS